MTDEQKEEEWKKRIEEPGDLISLNMGSGQYRHGKPIEEEEEDFSGLEPEEDENDDE